MAIGTILKAARKREGLSQRDVARALGISQGYFSDVEKDKREFKERWLANLPAEIRRDVAVALIAERQAEVDQLRGYAE